MQVGLRLRALCGENLAFRSLQPFTTERTEATEKTERLYRWVAAGFSGRFQPATARRMLPTRSSRKMERCLLFIFSS